MELTAENVTETIGKCFLSDAEVADLSITHGADSNDPESMLEAGHLIRAEGVVQSFGFHPDRLEAQRDNVRSLLEQLDSAFRESVGGGWSFLNGAVRKDGSLWGQHRDVEGLFVMAIALKLGDWVLPRELWGSLPGGMPYFVFHDKEDA